MAESKQTESENFVFALINNIPPFYHSSDLRNYFSQFIEDDGFICCHFKHRPEVKKDRESHRVSQTSDIQTVVSSHLRTETNENASSRTKHTFCCVAKLKVEKYSDFRTMYHKKHWLDKNGDSIPSLCSITQVNVSMNNQANFHMKYKTRGDKKKISPDREDVTLEDLQSMPELNPPTNVMPNGNVGTSTRIFLEMIKQCKLPPKVIAKLGLTFPNSRRKRRYGNVPFQYTDHRRTVYVISDSETSPPASPSRTTASSTSSLPISQRVSSSKRMTSPRNAMALNASASLTQSIYLPEQRSESIQTTSASGHQIESEGEFKMTQYLNEKRKTDTIHENEKKSEKYESESEEDADECEEWERHEALHDDPANVERNKERLFEEPIELKWEKGGSGLVFYTDAQYWKEQEGDFDEQTTDDWDVDMSVYYEQDGGDRDSRDLMRMRVEQRRRNGQEKTDLKTLGFLRDNSDKIGGFERHTKGIGRRVMARHGWTDGQTLGSSAAADALAEALDNDGQHPKDKRGLGYYGEKLQVGGPSLKKKPRKDVIISTIYDDKDSIDPPEPLMRRLEPYHLKHRDLTVPYQAFQRPRDPDLKQLK